MQAILKCSKKDGQQVTFSADYADAQHRPILQQFSQWTPSAHLTMCITNPAALEQIEEGGYYQVDFTRLPADGLPLK